MIAIILSDYHEITAIPRSELVTIFVTLLLRYVSETLWKFHNRFNKWQSHLLLALSGKMRILQVTIKRKIHATFTVVDKICYTLPYLELEQRDWGSNSPPDYSLCETSFVESVLYDPLGIWGRVAVLFGDTPHWRMKRHAHIATFWPQRLVA